MAQKKRETVRKEIRKNLIEQLEAKSAGLTLFEDLVDDYLELWDLKEALKQDIKDHGLVRTYETEKGFTEKENPAPKQLPIVNRQMLALLQQLGISADNVSGGGVGYPEL